MSRSSTTTSCSRADVAVDLYHARRPATCRSSTTTATCRREQMADDHRFRSITEIWLEGDHYKWRAMRAERRARAPLSPATPPTGRSSRPGRAPCPRRCATRSTTGRTWSSSGPSAIDDAARARHRARDLRPLQRAAGRRTASRPMGLLRAVPACAVVCTHRRSRRLAGAARGARRAPGPATTRLPDLAARQGAGGRRPRGLERLGRQRWSAAASAIGRRRSTSFLRGAREAARRLPRSSAAAPPTTASERILAAPLHRRARCAAIFDSAARRAGARRRRDATSCASALLHDLALLDHARGWVQQFHLGALRNNNTRACAGARARHRLRLHRRLRAGAAAGALPRPARRDRPARQDDPLQPEPAPTTSCFATMVGNFQDGTVPGKMQFGSAWWFLDQIDGMETQMRRALEHGPARRASSA